MSPIFMNGMLPAMADRLPLDGLRVLDCSRVLAGPFATMLLADLGADVVKVEPPGGDETRSWGPPFWGDPAERRSAYFAAVNRNKRSIVIDLRTDAGADLLGRLAARADLLLHNHRPSTAERLGLAAERLVSAHPRLIVVSVAGFPGGTSERERPAYDLLAQAASGLMAVTGEPDGPTIRTGVALLDLIAGLEAAVGALAALIGRGRVRSVEVGLVEAGVTSLVNVLGNLLASGEEPGRYGSAHPNIVPYQAFHASDGEVVIAIGNDAQFRALLSVLGLDDPEREFATNATRVANREALLPWLAVAIAKRGRDELVSALRAADVPAGPVNRVGEALADMEAAHADGWLQSLEGIRVAPDPILLDGSRLPLRRAPPRLGEHRDEVLRELEIGADELTELEAGGAFG
jgi:crotonobetainyl-CoA:carnitine CoA-transferase CaiB-like acyl-CoA transferase